MDDIELYLLKEMSNVSLHFWVIIQVAEYVRGLQPIEVKSPHLNTLEHFIGVLDFVARCCIPVFSADNLYFVSSSLQTLGQAQGQNFCTP
jgi:hypothetical protein